MKNKLYYLSLLCISSALLSLEISLMRMLRVEGFGNFTYGAIALALTGFGASGTAICLFREKIKNFEYELSYWSIALFILFLGLAYYLSEKVEFDSLRILWDRNQIFRLLLRYFLYTVPFITGSSFIVIAFILKTPGKVYFHNLTGSGFGILIILLGFYFIPPNRILLIPAILASSSFVIFACTLKPFQQYRVYAPPLAAAGIILLLLGDINILPYKGRQLALNLPDAEIVERRVSPFGTIEVIQSTKIRIAPGLSYTYEGWLPRQHGLFIDGDQLSAIDGITGEKSLEYLLYQAQSAVYTFHENPDAFIIGLGGGISVERAFRNGARTITVSEENPHLPILLQKRFTDFNNSFFHNENLTIIRGSGRNYISSSDKKWDIIDISEIRGLSSSIGGIYSADTNYTITVSAFRDYLNHIHKSGTVAATVPLQHPPRNLLKVVTTAKKALLSEGMVVTENIAVIRSWSSGTVLMKRVPFTDDELSAIKRFCNTMLFDLVYYPGIRKEEANQYNVVPNALYYSSVLQILKNEKSFLKRYVFNIKPATDDRPYFSYFFKVGKLPFLFREMGKKWLLVVEGGYIILFATFSATVLLSGIFIVLPPLLLRRRIRTKKLPILLYFSLIAVSFMFIEILLMQRYRQYIANPLYSNSMVIASLLIFSGIGSYFSDSYSNRGKTPLLYGLSGLSIYFLLLLFFLDALFMSLFKAPLFFRLTALIATTAPPGFVMGQFFPLAVRNLKERDAYSLPWGWSINGFFSVIASTGAVLVASNTGLFITGIIALGCYWAALLFFPEKTVTLQHT